MDDDKFLEKAERFLDRTWKESCDETWDEAEAELCYEIIEGRYARRKC